MAILTIAVDDEVSRQARIQALQAGTSVGALLRSQRRALVANADESASDRRDHSWSRDDLHER